ncbi:AAA family ATPase [Diaphorobacter sp. J5-51]|uniref:AAA family ATPase n=1 Tax=Diaphorobacter sp. J5-51 TaxID=680496 RepID=UPI00069A12F7|nr:ATP-binding protein [Diaphorobacter sp. J5-51]
MAKADDVFALAQAATTGERERVLNAVRVIAANEPAMSTLKTRLARLLQRTSAIPTMVEALPRELVGLLLPVAPGRALADVQLPVGVLSEAQDFLRQRKHADALLDAGLGCAHKLLLSGPPGNGKTTLAGALARELGLPLFCADFSALVSSHLGETGAKIAKVFRGLQTPAVLFLDEMETLLSERAGFGNATDVGEARRVVSTLLLEIDRLPEHIILIGATNHAEMLDRAVVRRFDFQWELPAPTEHQAKQWLDNFARQHPDLPIVHAALGLEPGASFSDIERQTLRWARQWRIAELEGETANA